MLVKWIRYCVIVVGCLVVLSGCEGCGCHSTCQPMLIESIEPFGDRFALINVNQPCTESCPTLSSQEGQNSWNGQSFVVGLDSHFVVNVTKQKAIFDQYKNIGPNGFVGNFANRRFGVVRISSGWFQTYEWDPFAVEKVRDLGAIWGGGNPDLDTLFQQYGHSSISKWRGDTLIIKIAPGVHPNYLWDMYSEKKTGLKLNGIFLQSSITGVVSMPELNKNFNKVWQDLSSDGNYMYGITSNNQDTAFWYKMSSDVIIDSFDLVISKIRSGKNMQIFEVCGEKQNSIGGSMVCTNRNYEADSSSVLKNNWNKVSYNRDGVMFNRGLTVQSYEMKELK